MVLMFPSFSKLWCWIMARKVFYRTLQCHSESFYLIVISSIELNQFVLDSKTTIVPDEMKFTSGKCWAIVFMRMGWTWVHVDLWPPNSHQFIFKSKRIFEGIWSNSLLTLLRYPTFENGMVWLQMGRWTSILTYVRFGQSNVSVLGSQLIKLSDEIPVTVSRSPIAMKACLTWGNDGWPITLYFIMCITTHRPVT